MDGDGHFGLSEGVNTSTDGLFADVGARTIATGDMDEDGRVDLLVGSQTAGSVAIFLVSRLSEGGDKRSPCAIATIVRDG